MYRSRLVLVTSLSLLALAAIAVLVFIPSYIALTLAVPPTPQAATARASNDADAAAVARAQALIREIGPLMNASTSPMRSMTDAVSLRAPGAVVTHITYAPSQITIEGSGSRDVVSAYRDALMKSGKYKTVSVPVGALVGNEGGHFSIILTGTF